MKKYRILIWLFAILAVLLSNAMCATVAYNYCALQWGGRYEGWSTPASVTFIYCIPYGIGIAICIALAFIFNKRHQKTS